MGKKKNFFQEQINDTKELRIEYEHKSTICTKYVQRRFSANSSLKAKRETIRVRVSPSFSVKIIK